MPLSTIALLSPGDMGHSVGQVLVDHSLRVITCLQGRSARTRRLAKRAGIEDVPTYEAMVGQADIILSILVPAQAKNAAQRVAQAMAATGARPLYADCNAIAPQTVREIAALVAEAGGRFVDASIIGGPPREGRVPRLYASGPHAASFEELSDYGLNVILLGDQVGDASAIKMCYGGLTKGLAALCAELLTAGELLGISRPLEEVLRTTQATLYDRMERGLPTMPMRSKRWIGEMEEVAKTLGSIGLTPKIHAGAADFYRLVAETPLAERTPEDPTPPPTLSEMLPVLAEQAKRGADAAGRDGCAPGR